MRAVETGFSPFTEDKPMYATCRHETMTRVESEFLIKSISAAAVNPKIVADNTTFSDYLKVSYY